MPDSNRPGIGDLTLLVYRECECGEWCATGEGAQAPRCGCGGLMQPLGCAETEDGLPRFGATNRENREIRSLGFIGLLTNEITAAKSLWRLKGLLGVSDAMLAHGPRGHARYSLPGEIRDAWQSQQVQAT